MNTRDILTLYDYHCWATRQVLATSLHISPEQWVGATDHGFGSVRGTLVHLVDAECAWRMLLQYQTLAFFRVLQEDAFPTVDVLIQRWNLEEQAMRDYLASLSDEELGVTVRYTTHEGERRERVLWHCLLHLINHGTQHRSEAAALLTGYGYSPGELDFTQFLNEQQGSGVEV